MRLSGLLELEQLHVDSNVDIFISQLHTQTQTRCNFASMWPGHTYTCSSRHHIPSCYSSVVCIGPEGAEADFLEDFSCWLPPRSVRDHSIELPAVIFEKGSAFAGLRFCGGTQGTSINVMKASADLCRLRQDCRIAFMWFAFMCMPSKSFLPKRLLMSCC